MRPVEQLNPASTVSGDGRLMEPVFVLCMGRSGSTLLRLILDTHPDLACPPETNIPSLCSQLAVVWSLIEGAPLSPQRGDAPPAIPDAAIVGIRKCMDLMTVPYLARRGKRVYCDKSLGTAMHAELLIRIYPGTRFICLYRHPMDVISSGLEACPWGLNGYGFDQYIAGSPGNAVMALARYWHDEAHQIAMVEENHSDKCFRVRYEDMVRDPERTAADLFDFIGVEPVPGIAQSLFAGEHERFGPADHKIWHTSKISSDSIGRSDSVPAALIPPPVLESMNQLLEKLGYATVDSKWGTADMPRSLLVSADGDAPSDAGEHEQVPGAAVLADRLEAGLARIGDGFGALMAETFTVMMRGPNDPGSAVWHVRPGTRTVVRGQSEDADWSIVGSPRAWQEVLDGQLNLSVALRSCELRYCDFEDNGPFVTEARVALLAAMLGLPSLGDLPAFAGERVSAPADKR
jgi:hypothetical protein